MTVVAKQFDGKVVEVVRVAHAVGFSDVVGWVMVCMDWQQPERKKQQFKWVPASTPFVWVREFTFGV